MEPLVGTFYNSWLIKNFISLEECGKYITFVDSKNFPQNIVPAPDITDYLWTKLRLLTSSIMEVTIDSKKWSLVGLSDFVTVSKHKYPLSIHKDTEGKTMYRGKIQKDLVCLYKVAIYLNDVSGTIFYDDKQKPLITTQPIPGNAVIFDMREFHSGDAIGSDKIKYMLGVRLLYKKS